MSSVSALNALRWNVTTILGPSLAGIILARFGAPIAYSIDLVTFIASLTAVFLIRAAPPASQTKNRPNLKSVVEGLHYAWRRKEILGTYLIDMNAMFFGMPTALFPAMAASFGAGTVGFFYAAPSVGALVATLTSGWAAKVNRHGLVVAIAAALWGVAMIFFGFAQNLYVALFFLALAGGFDMISAILMKFECTDEMSWCRFVQHGIIQVVDRILLSGGNSVDGLPNERSQDILIASSITSPIMITVWVSPGKIISLIDLLRMTCTHIL